MFLSTDRIKYIVLETGLLIPREEVLISQQQCELPHSPASLLTIMLTVTTMQREDCVCTCWIDGKLIVWWGYLHGNRRSSHQQWLQQANS